MKLYYFIIIAIGIMFTFNLAGIDTSSHLILNKLQVNNNQLNETELNPTVSESSVIATITGAGSFWIAVAAFFVVLMIAVSTRVSAGFVSFQATTESVFAGIAAFIFAMFSLDIFSILIKIRDITHGIGWEFNLTWIIIIPFLVGFTISLIEFIRGND